MKQTNNTHRRFSVKYFLIIAALVISVTQIGWMYHEDQQYVPVRIHAGDTVWNIAATAADGRNDVRDVVDGIIKVNNLSNNDDIYPGQVLKIPVPDARLDSVKAKFDVQS